MHIGYTDYVMGETITPSIQKGIHGLPFQDQELQRV